MAEGPFDVDTFIDKLNTTGQQREKAGPESVKENFRNQLSPIDNAVYIWRKQGAPQEKIDNLVKRGLDNVLNNFSTKLPNAKDIAKDMFSNSRNLSGYISLFDEEKPDTQ